MAYTAWSVVFGEQPTAAKWNQLGANDAGFKDGTNIDDSAIVARHYANASLAAAKTNFGGNYSTSEVNTGFTWIDGKTIYKKTINFGTLPNNTAKTVAHGISNFLMAIGVDAVAFDGTYSLILPQAHPTSAPQISLYVDNTYIAMNTGQNRTTYTGYVTIFYVKV